MNDTCSLQWWLYRVLPIWAIRRLRGRLVARDPGSRGTIDVVLLALRVQFRRLQVFLVYRSPCTTPTTTSLCWRSCRCTLKLSLATVMQRVKFLKNALIITVVHFDQFSFYSTSTFLMIICVIMYNNNNMWQNQPVGTLLHALNGQTLAPFNLGWSEDFPLRFFCIETDA